MYVYEKVLVRDGKHFLRLKPVHINSIVKVTVKINSQRSMCLIFGTTLNSLTGPSAFTKAGVHDQTSSVFTRQASGISLTIWLYIPQNISNINN